MYERGDIRVLLESSMEELVRGIDGAQCLRLGIRDGAKCDSTVVVLHFQGEALSEQAFLGCHFKFIHRGGHL